MWLIKRYARKSIYHVCMVWIEKSVTRVTVRHHSASLVMPNSDPRDRFFYPHHTPMKDIYNLQHQYPKVPSYVKEYSFNKFSIFTFISTLSHTADISM